MVPNIILVLPESTQRETIGSKMERRLQYGRRDGVESEKKT